MLGLASYVLSDFRTSPATTLRVTLPPYKGNKEKRISVFKNIRILVDEALLDSVTEHLLCHKITKVNLCEVLYHSLALTSAKL